MYWDFLIVYNEKRIDIQVAIYLATVTHRF